MAEFRLEGYETRMIMLEKSFNAVSVINLLNVIEWVIDGLTGAVQQFD